MSSVSSRPGTRLGAGPCRPTQCQTAPRARDAVRVSSPAPFPTQIRLENTNACNAHCTMCPRELLSRPKGFMDRDLFERILGQLDGREIKKFTIQGYGEPLLDKNFCHFIRRVKQELDCPTFTVSNGSVITPEFAKEMVASGLDKIKISFYGTNKEEYEAIHRPLNYEKTVRGIEALIEAKQAARSKMIIRLQYIGKWWKFPRFAWQWGTRVRIGYNTFHNYGDGRDFNKTEGKAKPCPILNEPIFQILWTGEVVPCCYDFDGKMILGDLREQTIEEIWEGERYQAIREAHVTGDFREWPVCVTCDKRF